MSNKASLDIPGDFYIDPCATDPFPVNLYVPFGAQNGIRLPALREVSVVVLWLHTFPRITGFCFGYDQGNRVTYGRHTGVHANVEGVVFVSCEYPSFPISGDQGERIAQVGFSRATYSGEKERIHAIAVSFISGYYVSTSFYRSFRRLVRSKSLIEPVLVA